MQSLIPVPQELFDQWNRPIRYGGMRKVQASEANLPQLLDEVERGETIVITRHGPPIARIAPETEAGRTRWTGRSPIYRNLASRPERRPSKKSSRLSARGANIDDFCGRRLDRRRLGIQ